MTISQSIRGALQTQLAAVVGIPAIAYEGVEYTPAIGTPFVEPTILPTVARPFDVPSRAVQHEGTFEIAVSYPTSFGTGQVEAMADAIRAAFAPGSDLIQSGTRVRVRWSERRPTLIDPQWIRIPVSVGWRASEAL